MPTLRGMGLESARGRRAARAVDRAHGALQLAIDVVRAMKWRMSQDTANTHVADDHRSHIRMFGKAWQWLTARSGSKQQGALRLFVHRDPMYQSFWRPIVTPDKQPGMQIQIYLEASNMAAGANRIVAAEIADMPATQTVIGVRDVKSRKFAHDNPLPARQLTTVSLDFLINGQSPSIGEPFRATVILTDHAGGRHSLVVIMH
jgi:hypothetical protein